MLGEKIGKSIIKPIIKAKKTFGIGISSSINKKMHYMMCKKKTEMKNYPEETLKNGKSMGKRNCTKCGCKKYTFLG